MKSKASVRIDWHGSDGSQVLKSAGKGAVVLTTLESGETSIQAVGEVNEIMVAASALQLCAKAFDKQEDPYIRGLIADGMYGLRQSAALIYDAMTGVEPAADPNNPLN